MHRRALLTLLASTLLACSSSPRTFGLEDLDDLVLQRSEAPTGMKVDQTSSGTEDLKSLAEDDATKEKGLREAGFVRARFQVFVTDETVGEGNRGVLASSFALLFLTADGASRGLTVFKDAIERDGSGLREIQLSAGEEAFGLVGTLEAGFPPGYAFLWRRSNVVLGLVAAGDIAGLNENAARELVGIMDAHAV